MKRQYQEYNKEKQEGKEWINVLSMIKIFICSNWNETNYIFESLQEHHLSIIDSLCNQTEGTKYILSSDLHGSGLYYRTTWKVPNKVTV